jgi:hypothetical protein
MFLILSNSMPKEPNEGNTHGYNNLTSGLSRRVGGIRLSLIAIKEIFLELSVR